MEEQKSTQSDATTWAENLEKEFIKRGFKKGNKTGTGIYISKKLKKPVEENSSDASKSNE